MDISERISSLRDTIRDVHDFPRPGVVFKDITTLLGDAAAFRRAVDLLTVLCGDHAIDRVAAVESRGFIIGSVLAHRLGVGLVPVRKPGRLPFRTVKVSYELEYGRDTLEIHEDALTRGERVLVVDDLIATGGTARAAADLVERLGGQVAAFAFLVELGFLKGRDKLTGYEVLSLIRY